MGARISCTGSTSPRRQTPSNSPSPGSCIHGEWGVVHACDALVVHE